MNRYLPMATIPFRPMAAYVPSAVFVASNPFVPYGAPGKKGKKKKGKGKKKTSAFMEALKKVGAAAGDLAQEGAEVLLEKKTGIDVSGSPSSGNEAVPEPASSGVEEKSKVPLIVGGLVAVLAIGGLGYYFKQRGNK